jgi:hypothetical protein
MSAELVGKNSAGRLYGLTAFCPIMLGTPEGENRSRGSLVRETLAGLDTDEDSIFASFPNTYLARFYVLRDVFYESKPAKKEHLKSQYLVFTTNFHGGLGQYLWDMWDHAEEAVRSIWAHCVAFDKVDGADAFVSYMKRCQVDNTLLFNGSTDEPLAEQLKGLYLKQEFGEFVASHQGLSAAELRREFGEFLQRVQLDDLERPTWRPGAASLDSVEVH